MIITEKLKEGIVKKRYCVAEIARKLGYSESFIREAEKRGKLPKAKRDINGWRVYTQDDINKLKSLLVSK